MGEFVSARVTACAGVDGQTTRIAGGPPMVDAIQPDVKLSKLSWAILSN
jgi:hypothetical protein